MTQIKKLEWRKLRDGEGGFVNDVQYRFVRHGWGGPEYGFEIYPTLQDAKNTAQADHEALIRNALENA